jgi:hypothetical protein
VAEELIVPMRLEPDAAIAALKGVERAGTRTGDAVAAGAKKADAGLQAASQGARTFMTQVMAIGTTDLARGALQQVGAAIGEEFKRSADYVKAMAKDFIELREAMQQVAALKGKQNDTGFALGEMKDAAKAGLSGQEWKSFQEAFQSKGGAYLEGDQNRFQGDKSTGETGEQQAKRYQLEQAEFAKAKGVNASDMAELGGGLLQFSEGPQTVEGMQERTGKVYHTLERAPTDAKLLMAQMGRTMSQGNSPEDAAKQLGLFSEIRPGEEGTYAASAQRSIEQMQQEGKGKEYGLTEGMTPWQKMQAVSGKLAESKTDEELNKRISDITSMHEGQAALKGLVTRGVRAHGFEREEGYVNETDPNEVKKSIGLYRESDAGKASRTKADAQLARMESGSQDAEIDEAKERARTELTREGAFKAPNAMGNLVRGTMGKLTGVDAQEQLVNERALFNAERLAPKGSLTEAGSDRYLGQGDEGQDRSRAKTFAFGNDQQRVDSELKELLKAIAENTKKDAVQSPHLSAPPAGQAGTRH